MTIIVVLKADADTVEFSNLLTKSGYLFTQIQGLPNFFTLNIGLAAFTLADHPDIKTIDEESEIHPCNQSITIQSNMLGGWHLPRIIRRRPPWNKRHIRLPINTFFRSVRTGFGVDYYILDTGVDTTHEEFEGRASQPYDYTSSFPLDGGGHGTLCAAFVTGKTCGVARRASVFSFKFHNSNAGATNTALITTIGQVLTHYNSRANLNRPAVLSISWSGFSSSINSAIDSLIDAGIVCCFPAANNLTDLGTINSYPAESDGDGIICGGLAMNDTPYYGGSHGTNWGIEVDILAPAQQLYTARRTEDGGGYVVGSGTSFATPIVGGVIACMLQGHSRLTSRTQVQAVKQKLLANATTGEFTTAYGMTLPDKIVYLNPNIDREEL